jgi:hypothetical protein
MSHQVKNALARNIDEEVAPNHDLLITYASSIPSDRLLTLDTWLKNGEPVGSYSGPKPTYSVVIDWKECEENEHVEMINQAMERCFGTRGASGCQLFIRGDQLNLLIGTFRKEYLRLKSMESSACDPRHLGRQSPRGDEENVSCFLPELQ